MRVQILGVPLDLMAFDEAVETVLGWSAAKQSRTAHFCNVHLTVAAHDSPVLARALERATLNATDGMPLVWVARLLGVRSQRVAGPDLMRSVMDRGRERGARHYLYGGAPGVAEALESRLLADLPDLRIVGTWSPPFRHATATELDADIARIQATDPDYVWVGLGAPKQDEWVENVRERLRVSGILAVGAAFDFHSGAKRRAPVWMQRIGAEWLFRLASEPRRLGRRYATTNSRFIGLAACELVRHKRRRDAS